MKRILVLVLGVITGFLAFEILGIPRTAPASRAAIVRKTPVNPGAMEKSTGFPSPPPNPESPKDPTMVLATARAASTRPGVFYFYRPNDLRRNNLPTEISQHLYEPERATLKGDAVFMAKLRAWVLNGIEDEFESAWRYLGWDSARSGQFVAIAADQVVDAILTPMTTEEEAVTQRWEYSAENLRKLAAIFSVEELDALVERGTVAREFSRLTETFARRGLTPLTRDQFDAMVVVDTEPGPNGPYLTRRFDPSVAPEGLSPEQRAYFENQQRWNKVRLLVDQLKSARVRDPEVWEIWPD